MIKNDIALHSVLSNLNVTENEVNLFKYKLDNAINFMQNELVAQLGFTGNLIDDIVNKDTLQGTLIVTLDNRGDVRELIKWLEKQEKSINYQLTEALHGENLQAIHTLTNNFVSKLTSLRLTLTNLEKKYLVDFKQKIINDVVNDFKLKNLPNDNGFLNDFVIADLLAILDNKIKGITKKDALNSVVSNAKIELTAILNSCYNDFLVYTDNINKLCNKYKEYPVLISYIKLYFLVPPTGIYKKYNNVDYFKVV